MKSAIESFFWGIIAAGAALFIELVLSLFLKLDYYGSTESALLAVMAISAFTEETIRYIVVFKKIDLISYGRGAIFNAWISGVGFWLVEAFLFYQKVASENLIIDRVSLLKTGFIHILTFGIFAYRVSIREDNRINLGALSLIILIHMAYNFSTQYENYAATVAENAILAALFLYNVFIFFIVNKKLAHE
ncbi:MAG: hypothetical protein PHH24_03255 [Candidatus Moranbacteria bacterium]|jgi:hypothetical protein|nr:hypothetical protein [Candidatus Moranbacteria bacterium]MDD5652054.1 hypothetical protein [Candidatus Moranbacteria bacterium]MDX9855940.1 hypothetical protein [Candidatus Moranbacteria bacterium]